MSPAGRRVVPALGAGVLALACVVLATCGTAAGGAEAGSVLARYDFSAARADVWNLPRALDEISGLATDGAGRLFAHDDEKAIVYELDPAAQRVVKRFAFGQPAARGDFEGIAVVGDRVYLTDSDGVLYAGRGGEDGEAVPFDTYPTGIGRSCEVEGLAWDEGVRSLLFACKTPRVAALRGRIALFAWSPQGGTSPSAPSIRVPLTAIARRLGHGAVSPSELLRDPATGHLLILAARAHAIVEITGSGDVVSVARLPRALHRQAEGLAFDRDGALLVSDEANGGRATLTAYPRVR